MKSFTSRVLCFNCREFCVLFWLLAVKHMSSEFLDRVIHGLRGLDHRHMPCIGDDPRLRLLHQTRYSIHPRSSHAQWKRYTLQIGIHIGGL